MASLVESQHKCRRLAAPARDRDAAGPGRCTGRRNRQAPLVSCRGSAYLRTSPRQSPGTTQAIMPITEFGQIAVEKKPPRVSVIPWPVAFFITVSVHEKIRPRSATADPSRLQLPGPEQWLNVTLPGLAHRGIPRPITGPGSPAPLVHRQARPDAGTWPWGDSLRIGSGVASSRTPRQAWQQFLHRQYLPGTPRGFRPPWGIGHLRGVWPAWMTGSCWAWSSRWWGPADRARRRVSC